MHEAMYVSLVMFLNLMNVPLLRKDGIPRVPLLVDGTITTVDGLDRADNGLRRTHAVVVVVIIDVYTNMVRTPLYTNLFFHVSLNTFEAIFARLEFLRVVILVLGVQCFRL